MDKKIEGHHGRSSNTQSSLKTLSLDDNTNNDRLQTLLIQWKTPLPSNPQFAQEIEFSTNKLSSPKQIEACPKLSLCLPQVDELSCALFVPSIPLQTPTAIQQPPLMV